MAGFDDGDSFFGDDDLDALPQDALQELENNAIQFTQAQTQARLEPPPSSDYGDDFDDEDLDDAVVIDQSRTIPSAPSYPNRNVSGQPPLRDQYRHQQHPNPSPILPNRQRPNPPPKFNQPNRYPPRPAVPQDDSLRVEQGSAPSTQPDLEVQRLQSIIEELTKERNFLINDVNAKAGEISIVRSKYETTVKQYEREMATQRKLDEDKLAKQQKALEAARIAEKNAATERDFIRRDLAEESERVRKLNKAREAEKKGLDQVTTPKKKKALPHRDGFDDDEIEIVSPSKISPSKFQKRLAGSPSKPGKRKRKTAESPASALQVIHSEESSESVPAAPILDEALIARLGIQDDRFDFLGMMLDHRVDGNGLRTFEELGKHAYSSAPNESFQAIILGKIPSLGFKKSSKDLEVDFCELLITIWANCAKEDHYAPVYLFIDMLTFALELNTPIAPHIIDSLLPVAQLTADQVAIKRFQKSRGPHEKYINVTACMSLLYLAAQGCMSDQEHIKRFWKLMRWDLVLFMLSTNQGPTDLNLMLDLLSTSITMETFGALPTEMTYAEQTNHILDKTGFHLVETPVTLLLVNNRESANKMISENWEEKDIFRLRIRTLQLMIAMTRSPFCCGIMESNHLLIGRLVSLVSDELDILYDFKPGRQDSARIITLGFRLLYFLVTKYENLDMQKKLSVIPGGTQKYILCLSRLHFSEDDLVLESGIEPDIAGLAFELLGLRVTPEEGDAIHDAFSSA